MEMTKAEISKKCRVSKQSVELYSRTGLIPPAKSIAYYGGKRGRVGVYEDADQIISRINRIKKETSKGYNLEKVREILGEEAKGRENERNKYLESLEKLLRQKRIFQDKKGVLDILSEYGRVISAPTFNFSSKLSSLIEQFGMITKARSEAIDYSLRNRQKGNQ